MATKLEMAEAAIRAVFSDRSVSQGTTKHRLETLAEGIEAMIESLADAESVEDDD